MYCVLIIVTVLVLLNCCLNVLIKMIFSECIDRNTFYPWINKVIAEIQILLQWTAAFTRDRGARGIIPRVAIKWWLIRIRDRYLSKIKTYQKAKTRVTRSIRHRWLIHHFCTCSMTHWCVSKCLCFSGYDWFFCINLKNGYVLQNFRHLQKLLKSQWQVQLVTKMLSTLPDACFI